MNRNDSYRDTGFEWVDKIPNHWDVRPLRYLAELSDKRNNDGVERRMLSVSQYFGIVEKEYGNDDQRRTDEESENYWVVEDENLVANTMWLNCRGIGVSRGVEGYVSPAYRVYKLDTEIVYPRFIHHLMRSDIYVGIYTKHLKGIRPNSLQVSTYDFQRITMVIPPLEEQKLISSYLNKKTEHIDSLIEKIKKKIKLLKEQRTSLINQCVTKGLAPNVKMKDSGIEWVGKIPKHWKLTRLKYIGFLYGGLSGKSGDNFNQDDNQYNKPYIPFTNISDNTYISRDNLREVVVYPGEVQNEVKQNDLFFLMSSEDYEGIGKSSVLRDDIGEAYLNSFCKGFRVTDVECNSFFINYLLSGHSYRELLRIEGKGFTRINLQMNKINDLEIYVPPINEQKHISKYLDKETSKIDTIIEKETKRIALLKEYRQSLISSVVTGKIRITEDIV